MYERIIYSENSQITETIFEIIDNEGPEAAIKELSNSYHIVGDRHMVVPELDAGTQDDLCTLETKEGKYFLTYNQSLGYFSLQFKEKE